MRGLAILLVIVWHYLVAGNLAEPDSAQALFNRVFSFAWAGVDLFFVLSGFLIGGILIDRRGSSDFFSRFWLRRIARLMPLYAVVLALYALARPLAGFLDPSREPWLFADAAAIPLWSYVLYLQNFYMAGANSFGSNWLSATWSLAVEEQFYLLAPLLLRFLPLRLLPGLLLALIAAAPLIRNIYYDTGGTLVGTYVLLPGRWEGLLIGILLAWGYRRPGLRMWLQHHPRWPLAALALACAGLAALIAAGEQIHAPGMIAAGYSYLPLVAAAVLVVVLSVRHPLVKRIFANTALAELGVISYGVYLLHQPVHGLLSLAVLGHNRPVSDARDLLVALASLALTIALANLSWRYLEKPIIDAAHRRPAALARMRKVIAAPLLRPLQYLPVLRG